MTAQFQNQSQDQQKYLNLPVNTDGLDGSPFDSMWYFAKMAMAAMGFVAIGVACMYLMITENRIAQRELNCINAACEKPCLDGQKLKRHEGCK